MEKGFIICVDDQPEIVNVLLTQLESAIGHTCEVEIAESAEEAFEIFVELEENGEQVELVVADEVMPGMQGSKFLEIVHKRNPDVMTMMLTGQAGLDDVVYAVNHAGLAKCLKKPWEFEDLKTIVLDLVGRARLNRRNNRLSQELIAEKNKAEAIVQSITDGILVINGEDRVSLVNRACEKILNRSEHELLGTRVLDVIELKELLLLLVEASQRSGDVVSREFTLPPTSTRQTVVHIMTIARALHDRHNHPLGVVTVLRDVTREREISAMKANFLSTMSHELRTPLTSILATFELLLQEDSLGELTEEQRDFLETSQQQSQVLSELIDNLIDLSILESNQMGLAPETFDVAELACEASMSAREAAQTRKLTFSLELEPDLPPLTADRTKIERMIKILLSNAVKFTKSGKITLRIGRVSPADSLADLGPVERLRLKNHQEWLHVTVADTGIGIVSENFDRIFEKFFQVDNSSTREFGGSGLGLPICKAIVEAHHGHIWVESQLEQGSTFHVLLPFTPGGEQESERITEKTT
jgi:PAS domain S-box-containing protein